MQLALVIVFGSVCEDERKAGTLAIGRSNGWSWADLCHLRMFPQTVNHPMFLTPAERGRIGGLLWVAFNANGFRNPMGFAPVVFFVGRFLGPRIPVLQLPAVFVSPIHESDKSGDRAQGDSSIEQAQPP